MKFFLFLLFVGFSFQLVVFEPYSDNTCTSALWGAKRLYLPITDYYQGVDTRVAIVMYNNMAPSILGIWAHVSPTNVTFMHNNGTLESWSVYENATSTVCISTPMYGFGRFYNTDPPALLVLRRTSGNVASWKPELCYKTVEYGWVAYAVLPVLNSAAPCPAAFPEVGVFYDGGDDVSFYTPGTAVWTAPQPCGSQSPPGGKCGTSGTLYCTKNANCAIDHSNKPVGYPFGGFGTYTVKIVSGNVVGGIGDTTQSLTTTPSSAGTKPHVYPAVISVTAFFALVF